MARTIPNLESLLGRVGVDITSDRGPELVGYCPKHEERTGYVDHNPSWSINRDSGLHHCWSCGYKGNVIGLVMDLTERNVSAARRMVRDLDMLVAGLEPPQDIAAEPPIDLLERFASFTAPPQEKMAERNLEAWACSMYAVRWNQHMQCWVIPWFNRSGEFIGWQEKGLGYYRNFPKGMRRGETVFGASSLEGQAFCLLVESPLDVVRLRQFHLDAVALGGTTLSSKAQQYLLSIVDKEVILALDNDEAGWSATTSIAHSLRGRIQTSIFNYLDAPPSSDPGSLSRVSIEEGIQDTFSAALIC